MNHKRKAPVRAGAIHQKNPNKLYRDYSNDITAETIAAGLDAKKRGDGWIARCPAHDDKRPSLSINESVDGRPLVHCFAGCSQQAVIDALRSMGLWHTVRPEIAIQRQQNRKVEKLKARLNTIKLIADADRAKGKTDTWTEQDKKLIALADKLVGES